MASSILSLLQASIKVLGSGVQASGSKQDTFPKEAWLSSWRLHLQVQHMPHPLLLLGLLYKPYPLKLLCIQLQQCPANDGVLGGSLQTDEVDVGTVLLAHILVTPQDHKSRPCQATQ